jgi:hypothetical protein
MQLDSPLAGRPDPRLESFMQLHMVRLGSNVLYEHQIYNFNQSSLYNV